MFLSAAFGLHFSLSLARDLVNFKEVRGNWVAVGLLEVDYSVITRYVRALGGASFRT